MVPWRRWCAVAVYLSTAQMVPIERLADTIKALFGIRVSTGWVSLARARAKTAVEPATEAWDVLLERALVVHPHRLGRTGGQTHARRLAVRIQARQQDYLRWMGDFAIPATNNTAEQSVRMIKTKTKTSGGFRTLAGLQQFLTIRGYLDTLRKTQCHIITDLRNALQATPGYSSLSPQ